MKILTFDHYQRLESYLPVDLLSWCGFLIGFVVVLVFILFRYFLLAGGAYMLYWKRRTLLHDKGLSKNQVKDEIKWSLVSSFIFALSGIVLGILWQLGLTKIYLKFDEYGWWYLIVSFFIYTLVHEVYFYFTHVLMHMPSFYKKIHAVHHASVKTTPWASFSFHPWEAIVHATFLPIMVLWIPIHPLTLICYLTFMTITAISNHLGAEIISKLWIKSFFISGEHHLFHHKKMKKNFGLYYTFMDRIMGTEGKYE